MAVETESRRKLIVGKRKRREKGKKMTIVRPAQPALGCDDVRSAAQDIDNGCWRLQSPEFQKREGMGKILGVRDWLEHP